MKRYTKKSKIKKLKIFRSLEKEHFFAEIIKDPAKNIEKKHHDELLSEVDDVVTRSWGKFEKSYLENNFINTHWLLLLRDAEKKLIGVAPIKRIKISGREVYSFGLTVVDPDYRGLGLLRKMDTILVKRVFLESLLRGKAKVEFIFITPNIKTISALARAAKFIYPNPYLFNLKDGRIAEADAETWATIREYLIAAKETYRKLSREGSVMEGFYDTRPHLVKPINNSSSDKKLNEFARKYLKPGSEVVVRAVVDLKGIFNG